MSEASDILSAYIESIRKHGGDYRFFSGGNEPNILHDEFDFAIDSSSSSSDSESNSGSDSESNSDSESSSGSDSEAKSNKKKVKKDLESTSIVGSGEIEEVNMDTEEIKKEKEEPTAMYMVINIDCKDLKDKITSLPQEKKVDEDIYTEIQSDEESSSTDSSPRIEEKKYGSNDTSYNLNSDQLVDIIKTLEI